MKHTIAESHDGGFAESHGRYWTHPQLHQPKHYSTLHHYRSVFRPHAPVGRHTRQAMRPCQEASQHPLMRDKASTLLNSTQASPFNRLPPSSLARRERHADQEAQASVQAEVSDLRRPKTQMLFDSELSSSKGSSAWRRRRTTVANEALWQLVHALLGGPARR